MKPPALRNFVPERKDDQRERPTFYQYQPKFTPVIRFESKVESLSLMDHIPQQPHARTMLPLREVNDHRKRWNQRGQGTHYDRSTVAATPPDGRIPGLGYDKVMRENNGNFDPKQRGLRVTTY